MQKDNTMGDTPFAIGSVAVSEQAGNSSFDKGQKLLAIGGIIGALAASSCCILPVLLFSLGIGGARVGNFSPLAPHPPHFVAPTLAFVVAGLWLRSSLATRRPGWGRACGSGPPAH